MAVPSSPSLPERQAALIADRPLGSANGFLMLAVGLVFLGTIAIGELTHYLGVKRRRAKLNRPL